MSNKDINEDVDSLETEELLNKAEEAFKKALEINPNYTRGHIGLGGVYFQQAQQLSPEQKLQTDSLDLAIDHYKLAVEGAVSSGDLQVEIKGRLGLGLAHRLKGDAYLRTQAYDEAGPVYDLAIEEIESALARLSQEQYRLSAQAYLGLGAAYFGKAYLTQFIRQEADASKPLYEDARAAYEHCIEQADQSPYDDLLQKIKNYCDPYGQEVQKVLDGL